MPAKRLRRAARRYERQALGSRATNRASVLRDWLAGSRGGLGAWRRTAGRRRQVRPINDRTVGPSGAAGCSEVVKDERRSIELLEALRLLEVTGDAVAVTDLELIVSVPDRQERAEQYEADQKDGGAMATASLGRNGL